LWPRDFWPRFSILVLPKEPCHLVILFNYNFAYQKIMKVMPSVHTYM
jgi:hypothetical protein